MTALIKITPFSKLVGLSVRTLHYYDEIELLTPEKIDQHGHRYYGNHSFSRAFLINSLKELGMSLTDIKNYLLQKTFSMNEFIQTEKHSIEKQIERLQSRKALLERIESYDYSFSLGDPTVIPLFTHPIMEQEIITKLREEKERLLAFDLAESQQFLADLDFCRLNQLTLDEPIAQKCITYWQKLLTSLGTQAEAVTKATETYYSHPPAYGMTAENYRYLTYLLTS